MNNKNEVFFIAEEGLAEAEASYLQLIEQIINQTESESASILEKEKKEVLEKNKSEFLRDFIKCYRGGFSEATWPLSDIGSIKDHLKWAVHSKKKIEDKHSTALTVRNESYTLCFHFGNALGNLTKAVLDFSNQEKLNQVIYEKKRFLSIFKDVVSLLKQLEPTSIRHVEALLENVIKMTRETSTPEQTRLLIQVAALFSN